MQIHITNMCEFHCKHCYIDECKTDLSIDVVEKIIREIKETSAFCVPSVNITGGDPLLHENWRDIIQLFCSAGIGVAILGTPKTVNDETLETLRRLGVKRFQISLDGLQDKHDYIRGEGSFRKAIDALRLLNAYGFVPYVMFTVSDYNKDDFYALADYLDKLQIPIILGFDFCVSIGKAKKNHLSFDMRYINTFIEEYVRKREQFISNKSQLVLAEKSHFICANKYIENSLTNSAKKTYSVISGCGAGWRNLCITENGDVFPCRRMPIRIGNAKESNIFDLFLHAPQMKELRDRKNYGICANCSKYAFCRGCPAMIYGENNTIFRTECPYYQFDGAPQACVDTENTFHNTSLSVMHDHIFNDQLLTAVFLRDKREKYELFMKDPKEWCKVHNISLTNEQLEFLVLSFYY